MQPTEAGGARPAIRRKADFGTAPVFLTAISQLVQLPGISGKENNMILLAYVILGHPDWKNGIIKVFTIFPGAELDEQKERLAALIKSGRLPIAARNVEFIAQEDDIDRKVIINEKSIDADLTIMGLQGKALKRQKTKLFEGFEQIGNLLFVNATKEIEIVSEEPETPAPLAPRGTDEPGAGAGNGRGDEPNGGRAPSGSERPKTE